MLLMATIYLGENNGKKTFAIICMKAYKNPKNPHRPIQFSHSNIAQIFKHRISMSVVIALILLHVSGLAASGNIRSISFCSKCYRF